MTEVALRAFVPHELRKEIPRDVPLNRIFVFDTETTTDEYQNLKIGSFAIYENGALDFRGLGLFYNPKCLSDIEKRNLRDYHQKYGIRVYTLEEFIENVFYPEVYYNQALCVGFNLPFDLSRLAISFNPSRRKMKGGFALRLSKNKKYPPIRIKHIHSKLGFIRFGSGLDRSGRKYRFSGNFLDLHTLAFSLTDDDHTLDSVSKKFKTSRQKLETEHGIVNEKYIDYNINDTLLTYELYLKLREEYEKYHLSLPLTNVYSPASIGKACLKKLGIKPFFEQNPDFPNEILGYVMTAYYGGRSEVRIRKQPVKVVLMDFLSMYPTVCTLQGLWQFVIAKSIRYYDDTENTKQLIENVKLEDINDKNLWKHLTAIVEIEPSEDILPVRCRYDGKNTFNIGVNYVTSDKPLWYMLSDVLASKLLTRRSPKIKRAIRFEPVCVQNTLRTTEIAGLKLDPKTDDLFKILIEERQKITNEDKRQIWKIITNATGYGIFIEINTDVKKYETEAFGLEPFKAITNENCGFYFNPLIAVFITSAARLMLATVEAILTTHGTIHAFCDTDSMAVPKEYHKEIQDFFKPLNPYNCEAELFKFEKENYKDKDPKKYMVDLLFFGISAKRYVLYYLDGNRIVIQKHSSHGLGHILNPFGENVSDWERDFWLDILHEYYGKKSENSLQEKYSSLYAISKISVSTSTILRRFSKFNKRKPLAKRIKPFNFILVGFGNKPNENNTDVVKPIAPFMKNPQSAVHGKFIDYNTGEIMEGLEYWKPMDIVFDEYKDHPESKSDGNIGRLRRKHMHIDDILYIGKESANLEVAGILVKPEYDKYNHMQILADKLLHLTPKQTKSLGIPRNTCWDAKKRILAGNPLKIYAKTAKRLLRGEINEQSNQFQDN